MTRRARPSSGFTLLELILALSLALLLIGSALSLFGLVFNEERMSSARFDSTTKLGVAHAVIERAMQSLVAGKPETDAPAKRLNPDGTPVIDGQDPAQRDPNADPNADPADPNAPPELNPDGTPKQPGVDQLGVGSGGDAAIKDEAGAAAENPLVTLLGLNTESDADHLELYFEEAEDGSVVPKLELVLASSPAPKALVKATQYGSGVEQARKQREEAAGVEEALLEKLRPWIRGAFELVRLNDGWALQWRSMEPPDDPFILVRGLASCSWRVLPKRDKEKPESNEWQPLWSAYLAEDFPIAVELSMVTMKGVRVDWVFETTVRPNDR